MLKQYVLKDIICQEYGNKNIRAYEENVKKTLAFKSDNDKKVAMFTGGLPGAGKSRLIKTFKNMRPDAVIINADDFRKLHPYYHDIMLKHRKNSSKITHADAALWAMQARNNALEVNASYILDSSLRSPATVEIELSKAKAKGYSIDIIMIASSINESMQGILGRYVDQIYTTGLGRYVDEEIAVKGFMSIQESAEVVESFAPDLFKIKNTYGKTIYDFSKNKEVSAKEIMSDAQYSLRKMDTRQQEAYIERWDIIIQLLRRLQIDIKDVELAIRYKQEALVEINIGLTEKKELVSRESIENSTQFEKPVTLIQNKLKQIYCLNAGDEGLVLFDDVDPLKAKKLDALQATEENKVHSCEADALLNEARRLCKQDGLPVDRTYLENNLLSVDNLYMLQKETVQAYRAKVNIETLDGLNVIKKGSFVLLENSGELLHLEMRDIRDGYLQVNCNNKVLSPTEERTGVLRTKAISIKL